VTDHIEFSDSEAQFSFRTNGTQYFVRTEVAADSFAHVVVEEVSGPQQPLEPEGDE
jgi:hypothetical protein